MSVRIKVLCLISVSVVLFITVTVIGIAPVPTSLANVSNSQFAIQILDRRGEPLAVAQDGGWNVHDVRALHQMPPLLVKAFITSEDKRFFDHSGIDWRARASALWQNTRHGRTVRGASTVTEQVVRMVHPRPRTLWSKWVETFDAYNLERRYSKAEILEFYLNQLPYAANRRGVAQGARHYFNRDISTLTEKETLALVILARAPSGYDLWKDDRRIDAEIFRLAGRLNIKANFTAGFDLQKPKPLINARHAARFIRSRNAAAGQGLFYSTIDGVLQQRVQAILDARIEALGRKNLQNAAVLVADHTTGEILAWAVADGAKTPAREIDAVTVPRQPGSALKPFLYASALDRGWTAATIIDDTPLSEAVGAGLHRFRNYSNTFYGRVPLREALANSLNIPAVRTVQFVGAGNYLDTLLKLGFVSLEHTADVYDDGLALGVGEVSLLEMVTAYAILANRGQARALTLIREESAQGGEAVFTAESASLVAHILSDNHARRLEFGASGVMNFPRQTALKTGTSTDYRDAWAFGFDDRYVAGIWMGNLDRSPTDGVTGASGPMLSLRAVFQELNAGRESRGLWLSPKLVLQDVCIVDAVDDQRCYVRSEYFVDGAPAAPLQKKHVELVKPTDGLHMALDPRVPAERQKFEFLVSGMQPEQEVEWILNDVKLGRTDGRYLWPLAKGQHSLQANVVDKGEIVTSLPAVRYIVK